MKEIGLFEAVYTLRAKRRLKPDPVPDEAIREIIKAATYAPSGSNRQPWAFVVVKDREKKKKIQEYYLKAWNIYIAQRPDIAPGTLPKEVDESLPKVIESAEYLAYHLHEAPVLILPCFTGRVGLSEAPVVVPEGAAPGALYPAIQNLMLAARGLGLGSTLTTMANAFEKEIQEILGIPESIRITAIIPIGYPRTKFTSPPRIPAEDLTFWDQWGNRANASK